MSTSTTTFRLYVYTAVDGYAWQGCENSLARELDGIRSTAVGRNRLPDPNGSPSPSTIIGGVLHCELLGSPGIAVWRVHVRRHGDFKGRDSRYIALLFLPRSRIDPRRVDYARLWEAPLLREPKAGDVSNLSIDLADPACPCLDTRPVPPLGDRLPDSFARPMENRQKAPSMDLLHDIVHNDLAQFGPLVIQVFPGDDETAPVIQWSYNPYPEVAAAAALALRLADSESGRRSAGELGTEASAAAGALSRLAGFRPDAPALAAYAKTFSATVADFRNTHPITAPEPDSVPSNGQNANAAPVPARPQAPVRQLPKPATSHVATPPVATDGGRRFPLPRHWKRLVFAAVLAFVLVFALGFALGTRFCPHRTVGCRPEGRLPSVTFPWFKR